MFPATLGKPRESQDQKPGTKKCGHMGGKVLVSTQEPDGKHLGRHFGIVIDSILIEQLEILS